LRQEENNGLLYYRFHSLTAYYGEILHGVFTRLGGVSRPPYHWLNVSKSVGDDQKAVDANHDLICQILGIRRGDIATAYQVHSANVAVVGPEDQGRVALQTDALVTNSPGVFLLLRFADCVPIAFYDPVQRAIGLAHAGWKGTLGKAAQKTVEAMTETYDSRPADLFACIGPSIGPCCYQVGGNVVRLVNEVFPQQPHLLHQQGDGSRHFDLWEANRLQLASLGVRQIEVSGLCTACHNDEFFSHRADNGRTGRFAVVMGLTLRRIEQR
jgi:YfiH family protein